LRIGKDGFLQLYYSRENASNDQDSIQRISRDGGASWGKAIAFSGHGIVARDGMLGLADYGNKLVAVFETNEGGPMHIKSVTSPGTSPPLFHDIHTFILTNPQMMEKPGTVANSYIERLAEWPQPLKSQIVVEP
jgi:hypothetical protein